MSAENGVTRRTGAKGTGPKGSGAQGGVAEPVARPRWPWIITLTLSVLGLAVALYLTIEHYTTAIPLACPDTGVVNCTKVTTSPESAVFGIPVALLGLLFFVAMVPLCLPVAWRSRRREVRWVRLGATLVGVLFVFYLVYTELFTLDAICLWCTTVHVLTVLLFAAVAMGTATGDPVD